MIDPDASTRSDGAMMDETKAPVAPFEGVPAYSSVEDFDNACRTGIEMVRARLSSIETFSGEPDIETVLKPADEMWRLMANTWQIAGLVQNTHPDEAYRNAADACDQDFVKLNTDISLSRPLYERVSAVDVSGADAATKYSYMKTVRDFKRSGVDKDETTREKIRTLIEDLNTLSQDFSRVIREDVREIMLDSVEELAGLPEDYIETHAPGEDGKIRITTDYPDLLPFMNYAENDAARLALRIAARDRGYPENEANLDGILDKRYELAQILGYSNYAAYITEDKMVGSPERAQGFIDEIAEIVKGPAARDKAILLERLKTIDPDAEEVQVWQYSYLAELERKDRYAIDSKTLRTYFPFSRVRAGIFALTQDLFGVTIKDWDTPLLDKTISAHEIWEGDRLVGRFYLDLHPRDGKYKHAAHFPVTLGIAGEQLPISALVCNFPGGGDPDALMEHDDLVTFLHEFGHLLHHQFAGHGAWLNNSGVSTEWDFVEAPSQLLEEWAYDYDTLSQFAVNDAGETIPEELVRQLNRARFFGTGIDTAIQTFYASLSMSYYNRDPGTFELFPLMLELEEKYSPFDYVPDTHFYTSFGHLDGYSAIYYTYQWSLSIAHDMFGRFLASGMRNPDVSIAYRKAVLDPGGSQPADELVEIFLGRPFTTDAYREWLNRTE